VLTWQRTRHTARRAGRSRALMLLGRAGFAARGVLYAIIGILALAIAFGNSSRQADQAGAVRVVAATPVGAVLLWLLAAGFAGMALWRLSQAAYGAPGGSRLAAVFKTVVYGFIAFAVLRYALGLGAPASSNRQAVDLTAAAMHHPGGQIVVGLIGAALIVAGAFLALSALRGRFLPVLRLDEMRPQVRRVVAALGRTGGTARGIVFGGAGAFLVSAAVSANAQRAKGVDATLRAFARTPAGPWLLVLVAAGLVTFGIFSLAEARWRRL
jgi:Domain of Unknown Function (DUF1206)